MCRDLRLPFREVSTGLLKDHSLRSSSLDGAFLQVPGCQKKRVSLCLLVRYAGGGQIGWVAQEENCQIDQEREHSAAQCNHRRNRPVEEMPETERRDQGGRRPECFVQVYCGICQPHAIPYVPDQLDGKGFLVDHPLNQSVNPRK